MNQASRLLKETTDKEADRLWTTVQKDLNRKGFSSKKQLKKRLFNSMKKEWERIVVEYPRNEWVNQILGYYVEYIDVHLLEGKVYSADELKDRAKKVGLSQ
ncbi:hypothetical protein ACNOIU_15935 (plasmid) [Exiguobacterium mexicanum]|uniref:hypothetical protein n=1 Tax=Exiguobacterium mexicanum TaxID=340146 RepID=UPI003AB39958